MADRKESIMDPAIRRKFEASFKLKVVNFAKEHNNCAAARRYGVTEKMVRDWKANEDALKSMPRSKCALRRGTPYWPELEKHVADMVLEHRQNGHVVTRNKIRLFALQWAKSNPENSKGFKATVSWSTRFLERHNLVLRQKTKIAQKLAADLEDKDATMPGEQQAEEEEEEEMQEEMVLLVKGEEEEGEEKYEVVKLKIPMDNKEVRVPPHSRAPPIAPKPASAPPSDRKCNDPNLPRT